MFLEFVVLQLTDYRAKRGEAKERQNPRVQTEAPCRAAARRGDVGKASYMTSPEAGMPAASGSEAPMSQPEARERG